MRTNDMTPATRDAARATGAYNNAVRKNVSFLKRTAELDTLFAINIPLPPGIGFLVPVFELHATDDGLIAKLAQRLEYLSSLATYEDSAQEVDGSLAHFLVLCKLSEVVAGGWLATGLVGVAS